MTRNSTLMGPMGPTYDGGWLVNVGGDYGRFPSQAEAQAYADRVAGLTPEHRARIAAAGREGWQRGYDTCVAEQERMGADYELDPGIIEEIGEDAYAAAAAKHGVEVADVMAWVTSRQDKDKDAPRWDAA